MDKLTIQDALVLAPFLSRQTNRQSHALQPAEQLEEIVLLSKAIKLNVVDTKSIKIQKIYSATFFSKTVMQDIESTIHQFSHVKLVIVDMPISGLQQRNLEKYWDVKVIDRTGLILEIFAERANTKEGKLQVELASCQYQKTRLVRAWTHLERQRGSLGFIGGPGESQLEIDKRLINDHIRVVKNRLNKVISTRASNRKMRKQIPTPIVVLVGYTNAGKSTLFNNLTNARVVEKDMLFTTLDPTMRQIKLPGTRRIILSDTVGFISNLPVELISAFKATLEEVQLADIILHVQDGSNPNFVNQRQSVNEVLASLGVTISKQNYIEVFNKTDTMNAEQRENIHLNYPKACMLSAKTGEGVGNLLTTIEQTMQQYAKEHIFKLYIQLIISQQILPILYKYASIYDLTHLSNVVNPDNLIVMCQISLNQTIINKIRQDIKTKMNHKIRMKLYDKKSCGVIMLRS